MSDNFLSQEEIDSLLNGGASSGADNKDNKNEDNKSEDKDKTNILSENDADVLGEVGNISMGSASTALSNILNQPVNITTPVVSITTFKKLRDGFEVPNIAVEVKYSSGIEGLSVLIMKITDASIIASLMMGGDGKNVSKELSEIEISAVSEAMNQMIGSSATAMATMLKREVNIMPPNCSIWDDKSLSLKEPIDENEDIVQISFNLTVGDLINSTIMQILPIKTAKHIVSIMMGGPESEPYEEASVGAKEAEETKKENNIKPKEEVPETPVESYETEYEEPQPRAAEKPKKKVEVQHASFSPLKETIVQKSPKNIDLILDVPLEISVVLGRTQKKIKEILNFGTGSLIELDKLAEEPVEILVNGKKVAYGEVVVVDENFGVRITSIVNNKDMVKTFGK